MADRRLCGQARAVWFAYAPRLASIARLYRETQGSMVELYRSLDADDWTKSVPCTPAWTVRDVLSHVAGVTDDIANRRIEGASTDLWTAAQVARWRDADPSTLIERWIAQIGHIADLVERISEFQPVLDCCAHEHDVRHALGRSNSRPSEVIDVLADHLSAVAAGGRPVAMTFANGATKTLPGKGEPIVLKGLSQFEFVRSRLGRRSRDQVAAYSWSEPPADDVLAGWFTFGPAEHPIVEAALARG